MQSDVAIMTYLSFFYIEKCVYRNLCEHDAYAIMQVIYSYSKDNHTPCRTMH